ncbi:MAG: hypothetical protein ABIG67_11110 [Pseudomonadota bacterium]
MFKSKTITLPKTMPAIEQISEVSRQLSEWLKTSDEPYGDRSILRLKKIEQNKKECLYHYEILKKEDKQGQ